MNKMTRRILALILTVCSLLSVMAPTVFASGTTAAAKTYSFNYDAYNEATGSSVSSELKFNDSSDPSGKIATAYANDKLDWRFGDVSNGALTNDSNTRLGNYGLRVRMQNDPNNNNTRQGTWATFNLKAPNPGTYSFVMTHGVYGNADGMEEVGVYMISYTGTAPDYNTISAQLTKESAAYLGSYSCDAVGTANSTGSNTPLDNTYTFAENTNYILVLKAEVGAETDSTDTPDYGTNDVHIYIKQLALTPVVPELDSTNTYNFNSGDLSDTVKADLTEDGSNYKFTNTTHTTIAADFDAGLRYWKIGSYYQAVLNSNTQFMDSGLRIRMYPFDEDYATSKNYTREGTWVSFPIAAPASGEKALVINHGTRGGEGGMEEVGVYMISYTDTAPTQAEIQTQLTKGSSAYVGSYSCDNATASGEGSATTPLDNTYTFADGTNYILVLKAEVAQETDESETNDYGKNDVYIYINQLSLVDPVASVGGTNYGSVSAAIEAAGSGTVTLEANASEDVVLTDGVTLDLAGNTLTGYVTAGGDAGNGKVIDSVGGGLVQCDKGDSLFNTDNGGYLPLYDSTKSGYRFFSYTAVSYAAKNDGNTADATETATFWFDIVFDKKDAYSLVSDLKVGFKLDWTGNTATPGVEYFDEEKNPVISQWANAEKNAATENYAFYLNVKGIENTALTTGNTVTVTPAATANGVEISFNAITYNVQ